MENNEVKALTTNFEDSMELLSKEEWRQYCGVGFFDNMVLDEKVLEGTSNILQNMRGALLYELITEHNNKVGNLRVTYALCMHYFNREIPDVPWCISPGKNGQSIQYFPKFEEEHYMRLFWFSYFADAYYFRLFSIWDSFLEIINRYYGLDYASDLRFRKKIMMWLKSNKKDIHDLFQNIQNDPLYKEANEYRTKAVHGTSASTIQNSVKIEKNVDKEILVFDENRSVVSKKVKADVISLSAGDYTDVKTLKSNMERFALFTGQRITEIVNLMLI